MSAAAAPESRPSEDGARNSLAEDRGNGNGNGARAAAISNMLVRLMAEYTGRGPTKARTYINEDLVTVVLQDTLTKGERSLVRDGRAGLVLSTRKA